MCRMGRCAARFYGECEGGAILVEGCYIEYGAGLVLGTAKRFWIGY